jgi:hypothetical protein
MSVVHMGVDLGLDVTKTLKYVLNGLVGRGVP